MRLGVSAALVGGRLVPGDVRVDGAAIGAAGLAGRGRGIAVPGFVDLQVNGFAGVDLATASAAGYATAGAALLATGVTAFQPTLVSAPEEQVRDALAAMPPSCGPRVLGAHLEGPFLARAGAHDPRHLRAPDRALAERLLAAGRVAHVTLAPELPGALELVGALARRGVTVALGHSDATAPQAHAAFDRGATTVTHLFNAMRPPTAREPGLAFAALARPDVTVQVIADGRHLAPETLSLAWRAAAGRLALVTDHAGPTLGGRALSAERTLPGGTLAGSALTMIEAVRALHAAGAPLEAALGAASTVPARIARRGRGLGLGLGGLEPGAPADVVVLDDDLTVRRVFAGGAEAPSTL